MTKKCYIEPQPRVIANPQYVSGVRSPHTHTRIQQNISRDLGGSGTPGSQFTRAEQVRDRSSGLAGSGGPETTNKCRELASTVRKSEDTTSQPYGARMTRRAGKLRRSRGPWLAGILGEFVLVRLRHDPALRNLLESEARRGATDSLAEKRRDSRRPRNKPRVFFILYFSKKNLQKYIFCFRFYSSIPLPSGCPLPGGRPPAARQGSGRLPPLI